TLISSASVDPKVIRPKVQAALEKAFQLDETIPEAHVALGTLKINNWEWAAAEAAYKRALELNPSFSRVHAQYANYLNCMGRHEEAIGEARLARELDPLSPPRNWRLGSVLVFARRFDEGIERLKKTLELDSNYRIAHVWIAYAY